MSPLLFVLVMENLSRILKVEMEQMCFRFHLGCKELNVCSLSFANDLPLFYKAEEGSVPCLMIAFSDFAEYTGIVANPTKTKMVIVRVEEEKKQRQLQIPRFENGEFSFRYLGVPIKPQRLTKRECCVLVDRMVASGGAWPTKKLTYE